MAGGEYVTEKSAQRLTTAEVENDLEIHTRKTEIHTHIFVMTLYALRMHSRVSCRVGVSRSGETTGVVQLY